MAHISSTGSVMTSARLSSTPGNDLGAAALPELRLGMGRRSGTPSGPRGRVGTPMLAWAMRNQDAGSTARDAGTVLPVRDPALEPVPAVAAYVAPPARRRVGSRRSRGARSSANARKHGAATAWEQPPVHEHPPESLAPVVREAVPEAVTKPTSTSPPEPEVLEIVPAAGIRQETLRGGRDSQSRTPSGTVELNPPSNRPRIRAPMSLGDKICRTGDFSNIAGISKVPGHMKVCGPSTTRRTHSIESISGGDPRETIYVRRKDRLADYTEILLQHTQMLTGR